MACREAYQPETITIVDKDGNVLADMSTREITKTFHIPSFGEMELPTIKECKAMWDENPLKYKKLIIQHWIKEKVEQCCKGSPRAIPQ